jgi:cell division protein FtsB
MSTNTFAARSINAIFLLASLAVAWQAVRFGFGEIGAPVVDQLQEAAQNAFGVAQPPADVGPIEALAAWSAKAVHFLCGVAVWLVAALLVRGTGKSLARIAEVGLAQYLAEAREHAAEEARLDRIRDERQRRRASRQARRAAEKGDSSVGLAAFVIGFFIGKML